jgi:hypothetical protein
MDCHGAARLAMTGIGGSAMPKTFATIPKTFVIARAKGPWQSIRLMDCRASLAMTKVLGIAAKALGIAMSSIPVIARPEGPWQSSKPRGLPRRFAPRNDDWFVYEPHEVDLL